MVTTDAELKLDLKAELEAKALLKATAALWLRVAVKASATLKVIVALGKWHSAKDCNGCEAEPELKIAVESRSMPQKGKRLFKVDRLLPFCWL